MAPFCQTFLFEFSFVQSSSVLYSPIVEKIENCEENLDKNNLTCHDYVHSWNYQCFEMIKNDYDCHCTCSSYTPTPVPTPTPVTWDVGSFNFLF